MAIIQSDGKQFKLDNYYLSLLDGNSIFKENIFSGVQKIAQLQQSNQSQDVIQSLKQFQSLKASSSSIFELLNKIAKNENVQEKVVNYINRFEKKLT